MKDNDFGNGPQKEPNDLAQLRWFLFGSGCFALTIMVLILLSPTHGRAALHYFAAAVMGLAGTSLVAGALFFQSWRPPRI